LDTVSDEEISGGSWKLTWSHKAHTAVLGMDFDYGMLAQRLKSGPLLQLIGVPPILSTHPDLDRWAIYANDTISLKKWSITPGIRYDHDSITGSFVSPSLGITYQLGTNSILRASIARGFTIPPLSWSSGGALFLEPNPSLDPEKVWSYQIGAESTAFKYLWIKATFFRHELDDTFTLELGGAGPPTFYNMVVNKGESRRQGLEIEAETIPFHNFTLRAGFAYVHLTPKSEAEQEDLYEYTISIRYDDKKSFSAELFGHYMWWNFFEPQKASYDDFIWDLNLKKIIYAKEETKTELFLTAHNLFNGSQYTFGDSRNPRRWVEAGIKVRF
jgi:vitamin B12 transporter